MCEVYHDVAPVARTRHVLISEKVYDEIRNQENIDARELGYFELKNIRQPVRIFAIANQGIIVPTRNSLQGKTKEPSNRLAVLPFVNMSADPEKCGGEIVGRCLQVLDLF